MGRIMDWITGADLREPAPLESDPSPRGRSGADMPQDFYFGGGITPATVRSARQAERLPVYAGCVNLIDGAWVDLPVRVLSAEDLKPIGRRVPPWARPDQTDPCPGLSRSAWMSRMMRPQLTEQITAVWIMSWRDGLPWHLCPLPAQYTSFHRGFGSDGRRRAVYNPGERGDERREFDEWMGRGDPASGSEEMFLPIMHYDDGSLRGRPSWEVLGRAVGWGLAAMQHSMLSFTHPAFRSLLYLDEPEAGPDQTDDFSEKMAKHMDEAANRHRPPVSNMKMGALQLGYTAQEAQQIETMHLVVEEVCRFFVVAPQLLALPTTTWGTGQLEMRRALHLLTMPAWIKPILTALNRTLPRGQMADVDTSESLRGDLTAEATAMDKLVGGPTWTPNEGRKHFRQPPVPGGDVLNSPRATAKVEVE